MTMETEVKVQSRQSLPDIALRATGSMEGAMEIAEANGLGLTDELQEEQRLYLPAPKKPEVVQRYKVQDIRPATALSEDDLALAQEGIGFMGIEIDFIVS